MKLINQLKAAALLGLLSGPALAHVGWEEINSVTCDNPYLCNNDPVELISGSTIYVVYDVIKQHGGAISIEFSQSGDHNVDNTVLKQGLPEASGFNTTEITLPDVECNMCSLRVLGSGYSGRAMVNVRAAQSHSSDAMSSSSADISSAGNMEVSNIVSVPEDNNLRIMWHGVTNYDALVLMSHELVEAKPMPGTTYQEMDAIGNAHVVYSGSMHEFHLTDLMPDTEYFFKIFTSNSTHDYSDGIAFSATTQNIGNNPPWAQLSVMQNMQETLTIDSHMGMVTISVTISDADADDSHTVDWAGTDASLVDTDDDPMTITFDPSQLASGHYLVMANINDSGTPTMSSATEASLFVSPLQMSSQMSSQSSSASHNSGGSRKGGSTNVFLILIVALMAGISTARSRYIHRAH